MGDEDYMFLPPVKLLVRKHQSATLKIILNSGHVCNVDQPDEFNRLSIAFISQHLT
jgi:pimeloyl-ACP methyl ester carboxylesterase